MVEFIVSFLYEYPACVILNGFWLSKSSNTTQNKTKGTNWLDKNDNKTKQTKNQTNTRATLDGMCHVL